MPPLTFTFKNIGPVQGAELELGDLTVIAGRNNTGKTYLVYTLYGFLKTWENWLEPAYAVRTRASRRPRPTARYPVFEAICEQVADKGQIELDVDRATLGRERIAAMNHLTRWFSTSRLASVFSSPPEKFENASIGLRLDEELPCDVGVVERGHASGEATRGPAYRFHSSLSGTASIRRSPSGRMSRPV